MTSAASLSERLIQAAVDYESGRCSSRELAEARAAVESAIPDDVDHGVCPACNGECAVEVETSPIEIDDLPDYACENCIGMIEHGCYCMAVGCVAPCTPAEDKIND